LIRDQEREKHSPRVTTSAQLQRLRRERRGGSWEPSEESRRGSAGRKSTQPGTKRPREKVGGSSHQSRNRKMLITILEIHWGLIITQLIATCGGRKVPDWSKRKKRRTAEKQNPGRFAAPADETESGRYVTSERTERTEVTTACWATLRKERRVHLKRDSRTCYVQEIRNWSRYLMSEERGGELYKKYLV